MSRQDRTVRALFWHDGGFRYARCTGPGAAPVELTLHQVVEVLEGHGINTAQPAP